MSAAVNINDLAGDKFVMDQKLDGLGDLFDSADTIKEISGFELFKIRLVLARGGRIRPGATALTRTVGANSSAIIFVSVKRVRLAR